MHPDCILALGIAVLFVMCGSEFMAELRENGYVTPRGLVSLTVLLAVLVGVLFYREVGL